MNKEKWAMIKYVEECEFNKRIRGVDMDLPENWSVFKSSIIGFIEEMDKATEVYNMENKK